MVQEGFAQVDVDPENDQLQDFLVEETKTEEEEWDEEDELLDRLHQDILSTEEKDLTELDIEVLSRRTESLEIKFNDK